MNQQLAKEKNLEVRAALDHFAENIFPKLFEGRTKHNPAYQRVYALVRERRLEIKGEENRVTDSWIISTLQEFGGKVGDKPRYQFDTVTNVRILE